MGLDLSPYRGCRSGMPRPPTFKGKRLAPTFAATLCDTMSRLQGPAHAGRGLSADRIRSGVVGVSKSLFLAGGFSPATRRRRRARPDRYET